MFDGTLAWTLSGGLSLVLWGMLLFTRTPGFRERAIRRFGTEIGVPLLAAGVSSTADERVAARTPAVTVEGVIGLAASVPPLIVNPSIASGAFAWPIVPPPNWRERRVRTSTVNCTNACPGIEIRRLASPGPLPRRWGTS